MTTSLAIGDQLNSQPLPPPQKLEVRVELKVPLLWLVPLESRPRPEALEDPASVSRKRHLGDSKTSRGPVPEEVIFLTMSQGKSLVGFPKRTK